MKDKKIQQRYYNGMKNQHERVCLWLISMNISTDMYVTHHCWLLVQNLYRLNMLEFAQIPLWAFTEQMLKSL